MSKTTTTVIEHLNAPDLMDPTYFWDTMVLEELTDLWMAMINEPINGLDAKRLKSYRAKLQILQQHIQHVEDLLT